MPGHSSRRKGKIAEYKIRDLWKSEGYNAIRVPISGSGAIKGDVKIFVNTSYYLTFEVKKRNKYPTYLQKIYDVLKHDHLTTFYTLYQSQATNKNTQILKLNLQQNIIEQENNNINVSGAPNILLPFKMFLWEYLQLIKLLKNRDLLKQRGIKGSKNKDKRQYSKTHFIDIMQTHTDSYYKLIVILSHQLMASFIETFVKQYLKNLKFDNTPYSTINNNTYQYENKIHITQSVPIQLQYIAYKTPKYLIRMLEQASRENALLVILANRTMPLYVIDFDIMLLV